ncbi:MULTISPECIES: RidA family protein [Bordetella]|uniref:Endoribonuclease L-PSP/chorismate mutase-like domain-containing protein n=2 Tax=Bordetella TaxID=517 RepID=A0A261VYK6_9BORD|nr:MULTISPECIES: RidA family protein [Bordetella]MDM9559983.1 RidA family protein [Bordetella petrii]OZI79089.1 hypothetical protein CAL24_03875 [Bordetella genomosp. 2]
MSSTLSARVQSLGLTLEPAAGPAANYVSKVQVGDLLFISGQVPRRNGEAVFLGRVGDTLSEEEGRQAARQAALCVLAQLADAVGDDLARVARVVRLGVFVACPPDFQRQSTVADGASDLMVDVLGDAGRHARTAVGVASLPRGVAVEVEAIVQIKP